MKDLKNNNEFTWIKDPQEPPDEPSVPCLVKFCAIQCVIDCSNLCVTRRS